MEPAQQRSIQVLVRFRPPMPSEEARPSSWALAGNSVTFTPSSRVFNFDHVIGGEATNSDLYKLSTAAIFQAVLKGFNGTILAYGQTSSGKTFTMGLGGGDSGPAGVVTLGMYDLFRAIQQVYNERMRDLLNEAADGGEVRLMEGPDGELLLRDLAERDVYGAEQAAAAIAEAMGRRSVAATSMNAQSSRSHSIVRMMVRSEPAESDDEQRGALIRTSVLTLVDLAGSERVDKTGAGGARLAEGNFINRSLTTLGTVISKLSEGKGGHINYRDSKLTFLLRNSLGGNSLTTIICCASPAHENEDETLSALYFAERAKRVVNVAGVNEEVSPDHTIKALQAQVLQLQRALESCEAEKARLLAQASAPEPATRRLATALPTAAVRLPGCQRHCIFQLSRLAQPEGARGDSIPVTGDDARTLDECLAASVASIRIGLRLIDGATS